MEKMRSVTIALMRYKVLFEPGKHILIMYQKTTNVKLVIFSVFLSHYYFLFLIILKYFSRETPSTRKLFKMTKTGKAVSRGMTNGRLIPSFQYIL